MWRRRRARSRGTSFRGDRDFAGGRNDSVDRVVAPGTDVCRDAGCIRGSGTRRVPSRVVPGELNFYGGESGPEQGNPCADAEGPLEHDHFFTAAGAFGSHDQNGDEVDSGDFEIVDDDTVGFPSHAAEFGYDGDLIVEYASGR